MYIFIRNIILLLSVWSFTSCGGGGGSGGGSGDSGYCVRNSQHMSKYGTCYQIQKLNLDADRPVYINETRYMSVSDDGDFVGDLESFSYIWSYTSSIDSQYITLDTSKVYDGSNSILSSKIGTIDVTLTVKDRDAVLDSKTVTLKVIDRPSPVLEVQKDDTRIEAYGEAYFRFIGSGNSLKGAKYEVKTVPLKILGTIIDAPDDIDAIGSSQQLDFESGYDNKLYYANMTFPVKSGDYTFQFYIEDTYGGKTDLNITMHAPIISTTTLMNSDLSISQYSASADRLFILSNDTLKSYATTSAEPSLVEMYKGFNSAKSLYLSKDGSKVVVVDKNSSYLFNTEHISAPIKKNSILDKNVSIDGTNYKIVKIKNDKGMVLTKQDYLFFYVDCFDYNFNKLVRLDISSGNIITMSPDISSDNHLYLNDNYLIAESYFHGKIYLLSSDLSTVLDSQAYRYDVEACFRSSDARDLIIDNIMYGIKDGCKWDILSASESNTTIVGQPYAMSDLVTKIHLAGERDIVKHRLHRYISKYSLDTKSIEDEVRMTKLYHNGKAYDYKLIYAFENSIGKRVGVGQISEPDDLNSSFVITIEK